MENKMFYCPQCGTKIGLQDNTKFCENCGYQIKEQDKKQTTTESQSFNLVDNEGDGGSSFFAVLKFALFVIGPLYLALFVYNFIFNPKENATEGDPYYLMEVQIVMLILGIAYFLIVIFWIFLIYHEVQSSKIKDLEKEVKRLARIIFYERKDKDN